MRENDFIEWLREAAGGELDAGLVPVGPGDDCAVILVGSERLCVSVDQVIDGVHVAVARDGVGKPLGVKASKSQEDDRCQRVSERQPSSGASLSSTTILPASGIRNA